MVVVDRTEPLFLIRSAHSLIDEPGVTVWVLEWYSDKPFTVDSSFPVSYNWMSTFGLNIDCNTAQKRGAEHQYD